MSREFASTLDVGTSLANKTGSWRTERPVYVDRLPPCNHACPAGENCQAWLYKAEEADYRGAWEEIMRNNPMPAIMGRACYHPCETSCNRAQLDSAVNIHAVERFLGDLAIDRGWTVEKLAVSTGKRVLVVGSGPAGIAAAYHLALLGHAVTIREAGSQPGGMMRYGIPKYRLPREVLDAEIGRILGLGVTVELNSKVEDVERAMIEGGFDACLLAIGAQLAKRVDIPAPDAARIVDALSLLGQMENNAPPPSLGRRVVVYGGGNTAIDAARTAKRLGGEPVIVYRRTRERMPAHDFEVQEALDEGITIRWLSTIAGVGEGAITIEKMRLNEAGWPEPTGEFETIEGDAVVLALGQDVDRGLLSHVSGLSLARDRALAVDDDMMTGRPGVFAAGDMASPEGGLPERTVTVAVGHGKRAARRIDSYLRGQVYHSNGGSELVTFDMLNPWYYSDAEPKVQPLLDALRRRTTFEEVVGGLDEDNALFEARRCLSCGNCFECDNCFGVCPDNAVVKLGPGLRFAIDYDYCKGCGMCAEECPCGAIEIVPEVI